MLYYDPVPNGTVKDMTNQELKVGDKLVSASNPEWGTFAVRQPLTGCESEGWEIQGRSGSIVLWKSEIERGFWKLAN